MEPAGEFRFETSGELAEEMRKLFQSGQIPYCPSLHIWNLLCAIASHGGENQPKTVPMMKKPGWFIRPIGRNVEFCYTYEKGKVSFYLRRLQIRDLN